MKPKRNYSGNYAVFIFYFLAGVLQKKNFFCDNEIYYLFASAIVIEILLPAISWKIMKGNSTNSRTDDEIG